MKAPRRRWLRWLGRGFALVAGVLALILVAAALVLGTSAGRRRVLDELLAQVAPRIAGRVEIDGLERLDPFALWLSGVRLYDPSGTERLSLASLGASFAPLDLLRGRIVLGRVELGPGRIDLRELDTPGRGLLAALLDPRTPAPPPAPDGQRPPPYVRIDRIELTALDLVAPALPPWDGLELSDLDLAGRFELDGAPELHIESLNADVRRGGLPLFEVAGVTAHLAHPALPSEATLELKLGAARLRASARAVLFPAAALEMSPLGAELHLEGLRAEELARLVGDPELARAFVGPVALQLSASGSLAQLSVSAELGTLAGAVVLRSELRQRRRLELRLSSRELVLARARPELPAAPLAFEAETSLDLTDPQHLPIAVRLRSGRFGSIALPEISARGVRSGAQIEDLRVELARGRSVLVVRGAADTEGAFALGTTADIRPQELAQWATVAGLPEPPRGRILADLRAERTPAGLLSIAGTVRAHHLRLPELGLDDARVDVDLRGPPLALGGRANVLLSGLALGERRVRRVELTLAGDPRGYRLRGRTDLDRLRATLDLSAQRDGPRFIVRGQAGGRYADAGFGLRIDRTVVDPSGDVETAGIALDAGGQRLHLSGKYGPDDADLSIEASALDLGKLAELGGLGSGWTGRGELAARLRGRPTVPSLEANLEVTEVSRDGRSKLGATLAARLEAEQGRANLELAAFAEPAPAAQHESRPVDASLTLASEFDGGVGWASRLLEARHHAALGLKRLDLAALVPWLARPLPVTGRLSASATFDGSLQQPVLHAELSGDVARAFGLRALALQQRLDYRDGALALRLDVDDSRGRWLGASAELDLPPGIEADLTKVAAAVGDLADSAAWKLELAIAERQLGTISSEIPPTLANLSLGGQLGLRHEARAEPTGRASFRVVEAAAGAHAGCVDAGVQLALEVELARQKLEATIAASRGGTRLMHATTRASLELATGLRGGAVTLGALSGELESKELDLSQVPYLCQRLRGRLDARARFGDALGGAPSLAADIQASGLSLGAEPSLDLKLSAHADGSRAEASASVRGPRGSSTLTARLPISWTSGRFAVAADAPLAIRAQLVELPIAPLLDPSGALSHARGWLSGDVAVAGTLKAPEPSGELELRDGELTATALAQPLNGVRGRFAFDHETLRIEEFEAKDRDGVLALSGTIERREPDGLQVKLDVRAKKFPLRQLGQVVATTSGRAKIDASLSRARSDVSVQLVDADTWLENFQTRTGIDLRAHPDFVIANGDGSAAATGAAAAQGPADAPGDDSTPPPAESHVSLDASDHFWIKRDDFAIQLAARLDATIVGAETRVVGRVDLFRGYLDLLGRVFEVDRGSHFEFTGGSPPDPLVDITAAYEHRASGKTVKVQISGRGSKPVLTFFIDDVEASAGEALEVLVGRRGNGNEDLARDGATSFVSGLTAGLLATSARRELGAAAPIIMIEPGEQTGEGRIRAGFELDALVPPALRQLITGVYVEGIVEREGSGSQGNQGQNASTQAGVLVELYFPHQLFSTGQWGPGTTWSLDWGWQL